MYFLLRCECAHCTSLVSQTAFEFVQLLNHLFFLIACCHALHFAILCSSLLQSNLRACHKLYPSSDELQFPDSSYGFSRYCDSKLLNKTYPRRLLSQTLPSPTHIFNPPSKQIIIAQPSVRLLRPTNFHN